MVSVLLTNQRKNGLVSSKETHHFHSRKDIKMNYFQMLLLSIPAILIATTVHEFTRAVVSAHFGDNLPKSKGRLTLNPLNHFEPIGFLLMFYSGGFGWGKPVETSALYYKNRKKDTLTVAIAPSVANLVMGFLFVIVTQALSSFASGTIITILYYCAYYNIALVVYNILPITPMDGGKVLAHFLPANKYFQYMQHEKTIQLVVIFLLFFGVFGNIFPVVINGILNLFSAFVGLIF